MTTDQWTERLSEYLDDQLAPADRLSLDRHLLDCAHCRETLAELKEVIADAHALTDSAPASDLWPRIRRELSADPARRRRITLSWPQALAAGVLLMLVSGASVWVAIDRTRDDGGVPARVDQRPVAVPISFADPKYDRAVEDLTRILNENRSRLNPTTVLVLERNLATIDRAIAEARAALDRDPADAFLNSHLAEQRQRKLALLREAKNLVRIGL